MTLLAEVAEVICSLHDRWRDAERKWGHTHQMPSLISDLITAPLGMFSLFTGHHDDGWLPGRLELLSCARLLDFLGVFLYLAQGMRSVSRTVAETDWNTYKHTKMHGVFVPLRKLFLRTFISFMFSFGRTEKKKSKVKTEGLQHVM